VKEPFPRLMSRLNERLLRDARLSALPVCTPWVSTVYEPGSPPSAVFEEPIFVNVPKLALPMAAVVLKERVLRAESVSDWAAS
jgi:hypothetical protein